MATTTTAAAAALASEPAVQKMEPLTPTLGKSGKKICCSCPDTKQLRDECVVQFGEEHCAALIEAHKVCLRAEGFKVK